MLVDTVRQNNDATLTNLGTKYQYFVALLECIKLDSNDKLIIEVLGDLSIISPNGSIQKEVKEHYKDNCLNDRHIDLWKTIKNWVENYTASMQFKSLILHTTSYMESKSVFNGWNNKSKEGKYEILEKIGQNFKSKEKTFRPYYEYIFKQDRDKLLKIFDKIKIDSSKEKIGEIYLGIENHPFFKSVEQQLRKKCIQLLIGYLFIKDTEPPYKLEVDAKEFEYHWRSTVKLLMSGVQCSLPDEFANGVPTDDEKTKLSTKRFVKEIEKINYNDKIQEAIVDYWRTNSTICEYACNYSIINFEDIRQYKDDLCGVFQYIYEDYCCDEKTKQNPISQSQKLYRNVMIRNPQPFGKIIINRPFFHKGMHHNLADEGLIQWLLEIGKGEENE